MKDDELFTLEEVRGGFSAKRTRLLLFQIENRTAYSMTQARRAVDPYLTEETAEQQDLAFFAALAEGEAARSWLALSPLLLIFLLVEWLLGNKLGSFSQLMDLRGVITVPVVAGVFPILLLLASRRKGENIPAFVLPFLAHPMVAGGIYLVAVSTLFLHGLLIWQDPFQQGMALLVGIIILAITALLMRQGAFACRMVIEVRQDPPLTQAQELMVWVHRVTLEGQSENLPVLVKVSWARQMREFHLNGAGQQFVLPLRAEGKQAGKEGPREVGPLEVEVQLATTTAEGTSPDDEAESQRLDIEA